MAVRKWEYRKIDGKYIYDEQATQYVNNSLSKMKQEIIDKRDP